MKKITRRLFMAFTAMVAAAGNLALRLSPRRHVYVIDMTGGYEPDLEPVLVVSDGRAFASCDRETGLSERMTWKLLVDRRTSYVASCERESCELVEALVFEPLLPKEQRRGRLQDAAREAAAEYKSRWLDGNETPPGETEPGRGHYRWCQSCYEAERVAEAKQRPTNEVQERFLAELQAMRFDRGHAV